MGKVIKQIVGENRDESGQRLLALSHFAMGLVNRYPHRIQGFTQYQHETAMNTAQVLREQEAQRQAAKKANRMKNRAIIGTVAGAALGGVTGGLTSVGAMGGMSAGAKIGGGIAGGDMSGVAGGLGTFASSAAQIDAGMGGVRRDPYDPYNDMPGGN